MSKFILVSPLLFIAFPAFAYLDPGSGNALVYLLVSLFGAVIYFLKSVFYRVFGFLRGEKSETRKNDEIVIFSEGRNYWLTFKPILEELINRNIPFTYLSMDVLDPALTIDHPCMHSQYVGENTSGFSRVAHAEGLIMLSTTPNIGTKGFPLPRPKKISCLVHIWHSVSDTSFYHIGALDKYDVALTVGECFIPSIRYIEEKRHLKAKEVISVGLPYLDELKANLNNNSQTDKSSTSKKTILIAPSWGDKNCLAIYGYDFIKELATKGFYLIIRPHPQSLIVEKKFIENIKKDLSKFPNISFDFDIDGSKSMQKADLLVSDKSSIRFDFAFLYEKPVLTLDIPLHDLNAYEASILDELWEETHSERLGMRITLEHKNNIVNAIQETLLITPQDIRSFRLETVSNWGHSSKEIVDWTLTKIQKLKSSNTVLVK